MLDLLYFSRAKTSEKQVVPIPDLVAIVLKRRPPAEKRARDDKVSLGHPLGARLLHPGGAGAL